MAEDVGSPLVEVPGLGNVSVIAEDVCLGNKEAGIDVLGLVAIIIFYLAVLAVNTSHTKLHHPEECENIHFFFYNFRLEFGQVGEQGEWNKIKNR